VLTSLRETTWFISANTKLWTAKNSLRWVSIHPWTFDYLLKLYMLPSFPPQLPVALVGTFHTLNMTRSGYKPFWSLTTLHEARKYNCVHGFTVCVIYLFTYLFIYFTFRVVAPHLKKCALTFYSTIRWWINCLRHAQVYSSSQFTTLLTTTCK